MRCHKQRLVPVLMTLSLLFLVVMPVWAADPEIDSLLRSPVGKDWATNGGNLTNQRYSTLKQIDTSNVYLAPSGRTLLISDVPDAAPTGSSHPQVCQG